MQKKRGNGARGTSPSRTDESQVRRHIDPNNQQSKFRFLSAVSRALNSWRFCEQKRKNYNEPRNYKNVGHLLWDVEFKLRIRRKHFRKFALFLRLNFLKGTLSFTALDLCYDCANVKSENRLRKVHRERFQQRVRLFRALQFRHSRQYSSHH